MNTRSIYVIRLIGFICAIIKKIVILIIILLLVLFSIIYLFFSYPKDVDFLTLPWLYKTEEILRFDVFNRVVLIPRYVEIEKANKDINATNEIEAFNNLLAYIKNIQYDETVHYYLRDGANCQTLTIFISDWATKNNIQYIVYTEPFHVYIKLNINNYWVVIDFNKELNVYYEYSKKSLL